MLIPETLRQEHMPMMIYSICKLVDYMEVRESDVVEQLILCKSTEDKDSADLARSIKRFAIDGGFIEDCDGILKTPFCSDDLISPKAFSQALLRELELEKNAWFDAMLRWCLNNKNQVDTVDNHKALLRNMVDDSLLKVINPSEDQVHGFVFWAEFLGIINQAGKKTGAISYSIDAILLEYLIRHPEDSRLGYIPVADFLKMLERDLFFIPLCYNSTTIGSALSMALVVLKKMKRIELKTVDDSQFTWHMDLMEIVDFESSFTHIKVI